MGKRSGVVFVVGERGGEQRLVAEVGRVVTPRAREREVKARRRRPKRLFAASVVARRPRRSNVVAQAMQGCGGLLVMLAIVAIAAPELASMEHPGGMALAGGMLIFGGVVHGLMWQAPPSIDEMPETSFVVGESGGGGDGEVPDAGGGDGGDAGGGD